MIRSARPRFRLAAAALLLLAATCRSQAAVSAKLRLEPPQENYFVGQSIRLILEVEVSDADLADGLRVNGLPSEPWARIGNLEALADERRTADGQLVTLKRFAAPLLLLQAGTRSFDPVLSGMVEQRTRSGWSSFVTRQSFHSRVARLTLSVTPLPEPRPDDFCGAVGRFALSAAISPATASPGDLVTLRWQLQGSGSLNEFRPPETAAFGHGKTYAPRIEALEEGRSVTVTQVFVPDSLEATEIPALQLEVFNPHSGSYEKLSAGPFALTMQTRAAVTVEHAAPTNALKPTVAAPGGARLLPETPDWQVPPARVVTPLLVLLAGIALSLLVLVALATYSRWLAVLLALLVVVATVVARRTLDRHSARDQLTLSAVAESRLCPAGTARRLDPIPAGTQLRILERTGHWLRVEQDGKPSVWIMQPEAEQGDSLPESAPPSTPNGAVQARCQASPEPAGSASASCTFFTSSARG